MQGAGILAAFLIEAALFLSTSSPKARARLGVLPPASLAAALTGITAITWLLAGGGELWQLAATTAAAAVFAFWYIRFPESDVPILILYGALALTKASSALYPIPWPRAPVPFIGELAWLRTLLVAALLFRRPVLTNYGFLPSKTEWLQGLKWFALFIPVALAVGIPIGFGKLRTLPDDSSKLALAVIGTFLGHFIFVALREEVLFRAMILPKAGIYVTTLLFGAVHLPFGQFPNWRFALLATIAGWFYAKSYQATGSIRSAMVTHALTNVVARVFLTT